jgi:hypothetical protein
MWISDKILISDTDENADYTTSEYEDLFASIKVTAKADTETVYYCDTFENAVTAINAETYASNTTRSLAKVGIYTDNDDNTTNFVLYDDISIDKRYDINNELDFNLYGHTITIENMVESSVTIVMLDGGSLINGTITGELTSENIRYISGVTGCKSFVINNMYFKKAPDQGRIYALGDGESLVIKNSKMENSNIIQFADETEGAAYLNNVEFYGKLIVNPNSKTVIDDSIIFADSPGCYISNSNGSYYQCPVGISNSGTLIFNSGYVFGIHSGIQTNNGSKTYVYGGTFESNDHGGFYFAHGPSGVAYIENANINGINYPANGQYRPGGVAPTIDGYTLEEVKTAFYVGGDTAQNGESIYLVNCNISAIGGPIFVLRSSTPQQNVYMSGVTFNNTRTNQYFRVDNLNTMKIYFGYNNNFENVNKIYKGSLITFDEARGQGVIIDTNVNYKGVLSPE